MVARAEPNLENLRTEYSVIGSYVTAMTGMRFQTMGDLHRGTWVHRQSRNTQRADPVLIAVVSFALWILDLRTAKSCGGSETEAKKSRSTTGVIREPQPLSFAVGR
jgi:hypothetical protein